MEKFSWQSRTQEGGKLIYEASYFGGWWQLQCRQKLPRGSRDATTAQTVDFTPEIWQELHELLLRKYNRRRVPWGLVQQVEDILADRATNLRRDLRRHD